MCIVTVDCSISGWLVHEIGNALAILHAGTAPIYLFEFVIASLSVVVKIYALWKCIQEQTFSKMTLIQYLYFRVLFNFRTVQSSIATVHYQVLVVCQLKKISCFLLKIFQLSLTTMFLNEKHKSITYLDLL